MIVDQIDKISRLVSFKKGPSVEPRPPTRVSEVRAGVFGTTGKWRADEGLTFGLSCRVYNA